MSTSSITNVNSKFYIATSEENLCAFSSDFTEYEKLSVPVEGFALTHYHSLLVLVGGVIRGTRDPTNQLWVSADGSSWKQSLPPMRFKRHMTSAVNSSGNPECLVVAGGITETMFECEWSNTVEVFIDGEWFTVKSLPGHPVYKPRSFIHNGTLIIGDEYSCCLRCYCHMESLLASCFQSQEDKKGLQVWKKFHHPGFLSSVLSFGQQLVAFGRKNIEMLHPFTHNWLKVGCMPEHDFYQVMQSFPNNFDMYRAASTVLATGEMILLGDQSSNNGELLLHKASLQCK